MMKIKNKERGQSLVELAISITILIYLLSGAIEFGIAFFQFVQLRDAAQEGALYGSINPSDYAGIETRARSASNTPIDLDPAATNPARVRILIDDIVVRANGADTGATVSPCEGHALKVAMAFDHQVFMPFIEKIIGDPRTLTASVTDTILQPPICP